MKENLTLGVQLFNLQEEVTRAQVRLDNIKFEREAVKNLKINAIENLTKAKSRDEEMVAEIAMTKEKGQ